MKTEINVHNMWVCYLLSWVISALQALMFDVGNSSLSWFSFTHPLSIPDCARIYLLNTLNVVQLMQLELLMCIFLEQLYTGSHESLDNLSLNTPLSILLFAVSYEVPPPRKKR